mgnify:CR=1 FL=1
MQIITTEQSKQIGLEIFLQSIRLLDRPADYRPPWGDLTRKRMMRLSRGRMDASQQEQKP